MSPCFSACDSNLQPECLCQVSSPCCGVALSSGSPAILVGIHNWKDTQTPLRVVRGPRGHHSSVCMVHGPLQRPDTWSTLEKVLLPRLEKYCVKSPCSSQSWLQVRNTWAHWQGLSWRAGAESQLWEAVLGNSLIIPDGNEPEIHMGGHQSL